VNDSNRNNNNGLRRLNYSNSSRENPSVFRDKERNDRVAGARRQMFSRDTKKPPIFVNIKLSNENLMPSCKTNGSVGYDLMVKEDIEIAARSSCIVPTGVSIGLPFGVEAQVRPRSSTLLKSNLFVQFGTIDTDYRGEIGIVVFNLSEEKCMLKAGDRIAQLVFSRFLKPTLKITDDLSTTERGTDGFGSTGRGSEGFSRPNRDAPRDGSPRDGFRSRDGFSSRSSGSRDFSSSRSSGPRNGFSSSRSSEPRDGSPRDGQPRDGQPRDGQPRDGFRSREPRERSSDFDKSNDSAESTRSNASKSSDSTEESVE
jgi:dUTP pyrophosphatase